MIYLLDVSQRASDDLERHKRSGDKKLAEKVYNLFTELSEHPRTGTGKPEQLKGYAAETWSRRINAKHRLIYEIHESDLVVIALSAYGHYCDK